MWSGVCMTKVVRPTPVLPRGPRIVRGLIAKAVLVCSVLLIGCGAAPKKEAAAPEGYDWSDYKGTFAPGGDQKSDIEPAKPAKSAAAAPAKESKPDKSADAKPDRGADSKAADSKSADAKPSTEAKTADSKVVASSDPKADLLGALSGGSVSATPSKKLSKGTIQGESVSSVSVDAVAGASKTVLKSKVVSSKVVVGREYEQLQVVMKGVALQIIRPAATPDPQGPKVRSPKVRSNALLKNESGWYDESANVLVLVKAPKKASSQKVLAAILTR